MNLRNVEEYSIGLDIGTGSVGWAVVDAKGDLCHFKGKPTWGSRLFPSAEPASTARVHRSQRRRYVRRRWRLDLLQGFFAEEVARVDPNFFVRLRQSHFVQDDRAWNYPLFNADDCSESEYYKRFPTIYHLRAWLMATDEAADIRLVYLALHNIVKYRGNFLRETERLSAADANTQAAVNRLCSALRVLCELDGLSCNSDASCMQKALEDAGMTRKERAEKFGRALGVGKAGDNLHGQRFAKAVSAAVVGLSSEMKNIFLVEAEKTKVYLSNEDDVESITAALGTCPYPEEAAEAFEAMRAVYSSFILGGILSGAPGETISVNKIAEYERYRGDLKLLKKLVREYAPRSYDAFFRGELYEGRNDYNPSKVQGYTKYNLGNMALPYDAFAKEVKKLFQGTQAEVDERYQTMMKGFESESFLRRLKTSDNGCIPYQLHLEEMRKIIENQGKHYPFLLENKDKIETLVTFRIPYYVGPLSLHQAPLSKTDVSVDGQTAYRFAWSRRKEGMENVAIRPWNWEDVIDRHASAEAFIRRMTGMCTYVQGAAVLPKCSLLYEEFCVLNELNGARWTQDGDDMRRFDYADRAGIVRDLFRRKRRVTYKDVAEWMMREHGHRGVVVSGGQGEAGFESKMSSYIFFCKDVFHVDELSGSDSDTAETIILWNTLFEDRSILREKLRDAYGDQLNEEQIKAICKKRFTGWGRLSHEFLCEIKAATDDGPKSIMDVLREGNPNNGCHFGSMVLMEVLHDDKLGFEQLIDERNRKYAGERGGLQLDDLPGSPALRRSINQALRIVEEIAGIAGKPPVNIFIEVTREDDMKKRGNRTKRHYDELLEKLKEEDEELWKELKKRSPEDLDERMKLYFAQRGKSLYSGARLDINRLSEYEVDHIIPRSYIKDDSLDNKALVLHSENQRKTDSLLLDESIRRKCSGYWRGLFEAKLISEKKYKNLRRSSISDAALKGFIARQLVETSQIVKFVRQMLNERYEDAKVVSIKASTSSELSKCCDFVKCREINDYHHAHDAYRACQLGRFIQLRHPTIIDNPIGSASLMRKFIQTQGRAHRGNHKKAFGSSGFIVESFMTSGFDRETGEVFRDTWDAVAEVDRMRHCLDYKDCFISRMPEETSGAFWDATIYSPRAGKNLTLPLKQGLDPAKYGSYSREQFAYFFIYEAIEPKKRKRLFVFEAVPVRVAASVASESCALERFARDDAASKGYEFVRVVRRKVRKYQLIEIGKDRLYITGKKEVRNATQLAFSQRQAAVFKDIVLGKEVSADDLSALYDEVVRKCSRFAPRLFRQLKIEGSQAAFLAASQVDQGRVIQRIVSITAAQTNMIDLTSIGGSKCSGCMNITFGKELVQDGITFIDQSVTGMFERRQRIGL